jgi:hypothetical protein
MLETFSFPILSPNSCNRIDIPGIKHQWFFASKHLCFLLQLQILYRIMKGNLGGVHYTNGSQFSRPSFRSFDRYDDQTVQNAVKNSAFGKKMNPFIPHLIELIQGRQQVHCLLP